jgi:hypothetical protein
MTGQSTNITLSPSLAIRYLRAIGWQLVNENERFSRLTLDYKGKSVEVILPTENGPTWDNTVLSVLNTLSQIREKSVEEIALEMKSVGFDVIRSKFPDQIVWNDTIQLDVAAEYTSKIKRLLSAAATVESYPTEYFWRRRKEAIDYSKGCRFGHTYRGSFGFTIESPLSKVESNQQTFDGIEPALPFERRVVQRLARGFQILDVASRNQDASILTNNFRTGMNANMFDEIIDMFFRTKTSSIVYSFTWSPEIRAPSNLQQSSQFELGPMQIEIMKDASSSLRTQESQRQKTVYGLVTKLKSEKHPTLDTNSEREIVVRWLSDEHGGVNVHMILDVSDYLNAVSAHKDGKAISVSGTLDRQSRTWRLLNPNDFRVEPI